METRMTPRVAARMRAVLFVDKNPDQIIPLAGIKYLKGRLTDISEGGVGVVIKKYYLPPGTNVHVLITGSPFKVKKAIELKGEIRYCRNIKYIQYQCGIKTLKISDEHRKAIKDYVAKSLDQ